MGVDSQSGPVPICRSGRLPLNFRHEDATVQLPTTGPPQADTFEQDAAPPVLPEPPPPLTPLPALPWLLGAPSVVHPPHVVASVIASARTACVLIERSPLPTACVRWCK